MLSETERLMAKFIVSVLDGNDGISRFSFEALCRVADSATGEFKRVLVSIIQRTDATDDCFYLNEGVAQDIRNDFMLN